MKHFLQFFYRHVRFSWILLAKYTSLAKHSMSLKHVECPISKSRVCCKPIMPFLIFLFTTFYKVLNFFIKSNITFFSRVSGISFASLSEKRVGKAIVAKNSTLNSLTGIWPLSGHLILLCCNISSFMISFCCLDFTGFNNILRSSVSSLFGKSSISSGPLSGSNSSLPLPFSHLTFERSGWNAF